MNKKMLVEKDPHQTRIAVLEDDRLTEILVEREQHGGVVGNVYKGRVTRVLPGMQAAFVNIGLDRDAFLYVSEVIEDLAAREDLELEAPEMAGLAQGEAAPAIEDLLQTGQELVVQVIKDPLVNKGARVTTQITLPSRNLVLLPSVRHFGVSRRIEQEEERQRLRQLVEGLRPEVGGWIVRTAGEGKTAEEMEIDRAYLTRLWEGIERRAEKASAPNLIHRDLDLALRAVRDLFGPDYGVLWVDGEETYERIVEFLDQIQPGLLPKVRLYQRQECSLFERFDIETEIEAALKNKVWLKSGGYLVIHPTEALVAIDVNTGRFVGKHNLEDTVLKTNLEAVKEVVRQIRLRDLGGIIVVDLIDMVESDNREQVSAALEQELAKDRSKNKVLKISEFGLVEITRKRSRSNLESQLTQPCPYCSGRGRIKAVGAICLNLRREILRQRDRFFHQELLLRIHPEVAQALEGPERAVLEELQEVLEANILLQSAPELHHESFDIFEV